MRHENFPRTFSDFPEARWIGAARRRNSSTTAPSRCAELQAQAEAELEMLPGDTPLTDMLGDYAVMRDG